MRLLTLPFFSPTPEITWLKKEGELDESRTVKDMFDRRLRLSDISESDSGEYQCIAKNTQGNAKHTYHLKVEGVSHSLLLHWHTVMRLQSHIFDHHILWNRYLAGVSK